MRKVTVMLPEDLIARAQRYTGEGLTPTLRAALENLAVKQVYKDILDMQGKVKFGLTDKDIREGREDKVRPLLRKR